MVVEEGHLRRAPEGGRLHVHPDYDASVVRGIERHFARHATVSFCNFPVSGLRDASRPLGGRH